MSSKIALVICFGFVLFLLRLDRQQAPKVSHALWIPTIWMLLTCSKSLSLWFGIEGSTIESGSTLDRNLLIALMCIAIGILAYRRFDFQSAIRQNSLVVIMLCYMLVSTLWSDIMFISLKRWLREIVAVLMAFLLLSERNPFEALLSLLRRTVYILIPFSFLLIRYFGKIGIKWNYWSGEAMWVGVTTQKNALGELSCFSAFFLIWLLIMRWKNNDVSVSKYQIYFDLIILVISLWILKGPSGRNFAATAITCFVLGILTLIILLMMKRFRIYLATNVLTVIVSICIVYGISVPIMGGMTLGFNAASMGRDATLTGRTEFWAELIPAGMKRPILGYGFGGFWTTESIIAFNISGPHNGYLAVFLEQGLLGVFLIYLFLIICAHRAHRLLTNNYLLGSFFIGYLFISLLHNITEAGFDSFTTQGTAILLFMFITFSSGTIYSSEVQNEDALL